MFRTISANRVANHWWLSDPLKEKLKKDKTFSTEQLNFLFKKSILQNKLYKRQPDGRTALKTQVFVQFVLLIKLQRSSQFNIMQPDFMHAYLETSPSVLYN